MADPASIITFIVLASQCALELSKFLELFKRHHEILKGLFDDVHSLSVILDSIHELAKSDASSFVLLKSPLQNCQDSCNAFLVLIRKCAKHSQGTTTSLIDAARLKLAEGDINDFRASLNSYKITISLSLQHVNLRKTSEKSEARESFQENIASVYSQLKARKCNLDNRLEVLRGSDVALPEAFIRQQRDLLAERSNIENCIAVCMKFARELQVSQQDLGANRTALRDPVSMTNAVGRAGSALHSCEEEMEKTVSELQESARTIDEELHSISVFKGTFGRSAIEQRTQQNIRHLEDLVRACSQYEAISRHAVVVNGISASDDNVHVAVNTGSGGLTVEDVEIGSRNRMIEGAMAPETLQLALQATTPSARAGRSSSNAAPLTMSSTPNNSKRMRGWRWWKTNNGDGTNSAGRPDHLQ